MAKKDALPLTPEELAAKKERKTEKRKIFGDTFVKALAVLLSIVLVYSVVYVAFGQGMTVIQKVNSTGAVAQGSGSQGGSTYDPGSSSAAPSGDTAAPAASGDSSSAAPAASGSGTAAPAASGSGTAAPAANDAAAVAAKINAATASAANGKAGYDWVRTCKWTTPVDVGNATGTLNKIIQTVSSDDDLNSVVGGFLGVGEKKGTIAKGGKFEYPEPNDPSKTTTYHGDDFALKATQLKAEDLQNLQVNGNTHTFTIPNVTSPQKDNSTAMSRLTNDIVVLSQVNQEIQEQVGSAVVVNELEANYKNIKVSVTVDGDKLVSLEFSHDADATLKLKAAVVPITGTGAIQTSVKYSNFKY